MSLETRQAKSFYVGVSSSDIDELRRDPAYRGSELESVPRKPGQDQNAVQLRMPVYDEVIVRSVVVEADLCLGDSRAGERRYRLPEKLPAIIDKALGRVSRVRVRIGLRTLVVVCDLHRASMVNRKPIETALQLEKDWKGARLEILRARSRGLKVSDFLPRCSQIAGEPGQKLSSPGPGTHEGLCAVESFSLSGLDFYRALA